MACTTCGSPRCNSTQCCENFSGASKASTPSCTVACPEDHLQKIVEQCYVPSVRPSNSWNVPACGDFAILVIPHLTSAPIGSYLWNETYGYFRVTSFDSVSGQVTVINDCTDGNAAPGTTVPACSEFIFTDPPAVTTPSDVCVEVSFTAPAVGDCIDIEVTQLGSMQVGDIILIGTGRYRVGALNGPTSIEICNDGLGITPGTPVIAKDAQGRYRYCISIESDCCTNILDEFGGSLTPCSDFEMKGVGGEDISTDIADTPLTVVAVTSDTAESGLITNTSTCRTMKLHYIIQVLSTVEVDAGAGGDSIGITVSAEENGVPITIDPFENTYIALGANVAQYCERLTYTYVRSLAPGQSSSMVVEASIDRQYGVGPDMELTDFRVKVTWIGFAVE